MTDLVTNMENMENVAKWIKLYYMLRGHMPSQADLKLKFPDLDHSTLNGGIALAAGWE